MTGLAQWARSAAAVIVFAALAISATSTVEAASKARINRVQRVDGVQPAATMQANRNSFQAQTFTISQVLAEHDRGSIGSDAFDRRPFRVAAFGSWRLRGSLADWQAEPPARLVGREEWQGLFTFRAPEGLLWVKWRGVEARIQKEIAVVAPCRDDADSCPTPEARRFAGMVAAAKGRQGRARLEEVNRTINSAIRYTSDFVQHGEADVWSSPLATLASGRGDCEDYAIAKYVVLREAGVAPEELRLLLVRDMSGATDHAVLAARQDGEWLVLDNRHADLRRSPEVRQYLPLFAIDHEGVKLFASPYAAGGTPATGVEALNVSR